MPHEQPLFPRQFTLPRHPFIVFIIYILSKCFRKYKEYFLVTFNICGGAGEVQKKVIRLDFHKYPWYTGKIEWGCFRSSGYLPFTVSGVVEKAILAPTASNARVAVINNKAVVTARKKGK